MKVSISLHFALPHIITTAMLLSASLSRADELHAQADEFYAAAAALLPAYQGVPAPVDPADCQAVGGWTNRIVFPHVPVTVANLPDGRVLSFASNQRTSFPSGPEFTYAAVYNPDTGNITEINWNQHDMFCGGTVLRTDGRFQVMGGRNTTQRSSFFDWRTNAWSRAADMNDPRWYTTAVALATGEVFTASGSGGPNSAERYNGTAWTRLTGINWSPIANYPSIEANWTPFIFTAPNGNLFHAGPTDKMYWVNPTGTGSLTDSGLVVPGTWYPKDAAVAVYDVGKILFAGGLNTPNAETPTNKAFTVDLNTTPPTVTEVAPMISIRRFANGVTLPNGEVLVMGGNTSGQKFSDVGTVLSPEIWNPKTGQWRKVADMAVPRNYHSVSLMLADGRVLSGGGGLAGNAAVDHADIQLYSPPCLFTATGTAAVRPELTTAPTSIGLTGRFNVTATAGLKKFTFIRMTSITHGFTADQRFVSLPFSETSPGNYELSPHPNRHIMTPGYWMLFGLNENGTHSKAKIVKVDEAATVAIPGSNLALNKPAIQSSDLSASNLAAKAVDGVTAGNFTTTPGSSTTAELNPYWEVDLGNTYTLNAIRISNRTDNNGELLKDFNVHVSRFPFSATNTDYTSYRHSFMAGAVANVNLYRDARYVRIQMNGTGTLQLAEVEVLGNPTPVSALALQNPGTVYSDRGLPASLQMVSSNAGSVQFAASGLPTGMTINPNTGLVTGTPSTVGDFNVTVNASMTNGSADSESFTWTIHPTGERPGVLYSYYEGAWTNLPDFNTLTAQASGELINFSLSPRLRADNFAMLYRSCLRIPTAGTWTFYTNSDDGTQVWIDGVLVMNHDGVHTASERSATVNLTAGVHSITVGYLQSVGASSLALSYAGPGVAKQLIPNAALFQPKPGVRYDYYEGAFAALPNFAALTPVKSGDIDSFSLAPRNVNDGFAFRYQANIRVPTAGTYTFYTNSDDGSKLYINGTLVVNNDGLHGPVEAQGQISLTAGSHAIVVEFFEQAGGETLIVSYAGPGLPKQVIQPGALALHGLPGAPPVVAAIPNQQHQVGNSVNLQVSATDPNGDNMTYTATGLPAGVGIGATSGLISGVPTTAGSSNVTVTVSDGTGRSGSTSFTWTVVAQLNLQPLVASPKPLNTAINYSVISSGGANPRFKWNFGDGTAETAYSATRTASHTYTLPGRYQVTMTATDDTGVVLTANFYQAVHAVLTTRKPTHSSPLAYETRATGGNRVWNVNPDQDTVSVFNASTNVKAGEITVGDQPVSVAVAPNGNVWVVNKRTSSISVISPTSLTVTSTISLPRAWGPHGLAFSPTGDFAYVAFEYTGMVAKLNPTTGATVTNSSMGMCPRHLSVNADGTKLYVTRYITPSLPGESTATIVTTSAGAEVGVFNTTTMAKTKTIILQHSERPDAENAGRGIPNYLGAPVISPDATAAWVPSKQDNIKRGMLRNGVDLTHDSTVRSIASRIALGAETEDYAARLDFDDSGTPSAAVYDQTGIYLFVAMEGSRDVAVVDAHAKAVLFKFDAGRAPQGLIVSPDNNFLYVQNFMDRSVTVHNIGNIINGGQPAAAQVSLAATWNAVATETLTAQVLKGKQFFYDARDPRLALQNYISCASCHNDGGHDGRTWDFTGVGEGLRNTTDLRGKAGVAGQGPAHWTGNFDEIHDFEKQIRSLARGTGLMTDAQFNTGTRNQPLGDPKAGVSPDLDALAAYVSSLTKEEASPYRNTDGTLTAAAVAGKEVFRAANCAECHSGNGFTNSAVNVLRDVGTIKPSSGKRLGATLTGFDTPSLRGIWGSAPYLHDGSAPTLTGAVLSHSGVSLSSTDLVNLAAYLQQIDADELTAPTPVPPENLVGLKAEFFNGTTPGVGAPLLTRTDNTINFDWGSSAPAPQVPADNFSVRWTGFISAPYTETFTIYAPCDDGIRIWINNQQVLNQWPNPGGWPNFTIALTKGQKLPIRVEFYDAGGGAGISLYWFSASQGWEAIPDFSQSGVTVNHPPAITTPLTQTTVRSKAASYQIVAADQDGDPLTYSATGLPMGLSINATTGLISGNVNLLAASTNTVTVTVKDPANTSASATFTWNTTAPPPNTPPVINNPGNQSFVRGTIASLSLIASDPEGSALTWSATGLPQGLSINATTGLISGTVNTAAAASGTSTVTVTDTGNLSASTTFNFVTTAPPLNGLKGEYFSGITPGAGSLLLTRTDNTINFDWGSGAPAPTVPSDQFSVRWTGEIMAAYTETYNFALPCDNGVRVWINNQLVLDKWTPGDITGWFNFSAPLTAGVRTPIKIEYFEAYGGAGLTLYWYSVRQSWEVIPANRFFPATTLPQNSAELAVDMVTKTQSIIDPGDGNRYLAFRRPSSSSAIVNLIVEESTNLKDWHISNHEALVYQDNNGVDWIYIPVPVPGTATAESGSAPAQPTGYYRVRFVAPDQFTTPP